MSRARALAGADERDLGPGFFVDRGHLGDAPTVVISRRIPRSRR